MKIVIDISEELYAKVPYLINKGSVLIGDVLEAVENGTQMEAQPTDECEENGSPWCLGHCPYNTDVQPTDKCKGCYYNDGETHAECVVCDKEAQPSDEKNYLKRREKDYVSYNIEWLLKHWEQELDLLSGGKIKACEDAVSREALINKATSWNTHFTDSERYVSLSDIEALPSVTPQRPKGKWIEKTVNDSEDEGQEAIEVWQSAKCNKCKKYHTTPYMYYFDNFNYCPNCGSYNGGEEDG